MTRRRKISKRRVDSAAAKNASQVSKVIHVQEQQIDALQDELNVYKGIVTGVANLTFDHVNVETGEVTRKKLIDKEK